MAENNTSEPVKMPGKHELIADLAKFFPTENASTVVGPGDDASVVETDGNQTVTSAKVVVENVHFDLTYFPLRHLGYKLATVVFSDVLAMNASPSQLMVNIAVSDRFDLRMVNEILSGVGACCETVHADLAGLDLTTSPRELVVSITAIGECAPAQLCTRKGASENELICVSGDFAAAYTGLLLLEREKNASRRTPARSPTSQARTISCAASSSPSRASTSSRNCARRRSSPPPWPMSAKAWPPPSCRFARPHKKGAYCLKKNFR